MKLSEYKPEIEFMSIIKENEEFLSIKYKIEEQDNALLDYAIKKQIIAVNLPYINCNDAEGNKLYLFDVVEYKYNYGNAVDKGIILYNQICYNIFNNKDIFPICNIDFIKRIGSIYELPEIQKQFNIEV